MALRIGTQEVQKLYLGTTILTNITIADTNVITPTAPALLLESGDYLLTEDAFRLLLETNTTG